MQRANQPGGFECDVQLVGIFEGLGIERDDRIDRRSLLVIRCDAIQIKLDELAAGKLLRFVGDMNLFDGRLHEAEGLPLAPAIVWHKKEHRKQGQRQARRRFGKPRTEQPDSSF